MSNNNYSVLVGVPCLADIKAETTASLIQYYRLCQTPSLIEFARHTYTHQARNKLVWEAVNRGATHLMFIDADMTFPHDAVDQLISRDKDIIGGLYYTRYLPTKPVIKRRDRKRLIDIPQPPHITQPFQVDVIGTGFLLIKMDVFKRLEPPFFYHTTPSSFGLMEHPFPNNEVGEDVAFCLNAKKAGYEIWCDPTIEIGHVGNKIYSSKDTLDKGT